MPSDPAGPEAGGAPRAGRVRPMRREDLPAVLAIERSSFGTPWPRTAFLEEMRNPIARCLVVTGPGPDPAGYICYWIVADECAINNIAVAAESRRRGLGRLLMARALEEARGAGCRDAWLEVRPSNAAARGLYAGLGFGVATRRPAYYSDGREDALVMHCSLESP